VFIYIYVYIYMYMLYIYIYQRTWSALGLPRRRCERMPFGASSAGSLTRTGAAESWPQHQSLPSAPTAAECASPAATLATAQPESASILTQTPTIINVNTRFRYHFLSVQPGGGKGFLRPYWLLSPFLT